MQPSSLRRFPVCRHAGHSSFPTPQILLFLLQTLVWKVTRTQYCVSGNIARMAELPTPTHSEPSFSYDPSLSRFTVSSRLYLDQHPSTEFAYIATGVVVFSTSDPETPRILLLQRAAGDSMPNRWEVAGGGCDTDDESILHSARRELWEETGLKATHFRALIGEPHLFASTSGKKVCKFIFLVEANKDPQGGLEVKLDAKEHQRFVWASKEEVSIKQVGETELQFTHNNMENVVLTSFNYFDTSF